MQSIIAKAQSARSLKIAAPLCVAATLLVPSGAQAQRPSELVDGIVAVVDDTAVLISELQEYVFNLQINEGMSIPEDPQERKALYRQALEQKVNEVILYVHAKRQDITVPERNVEERVDERIGLIKRQYNSELEYQQALASIGMTEAEFRIQLTEQARTALISRDFLQQTVSQAQPIPVSDEEIRDVFEAQKRSLGPKPAMITLKQVIIAPQPSEEARLAAEEEAERALSRARTGEDFGKLAREYSDDPASREEGGDLGWVQRGQLLPEFEEALFAMRPGQISDIVKTSVGLHIIKLERVRGNERLARHILIQPELSDADIARAQELAARVAAEIRAGVDIDSLINVYHDPVQPSSLTDIPRDRLQPPEFAAALEGAGEGDIVGPIRVSAGSIGPRFAVVEVTDTTAAGEWMLDDWRERIRQQVEQNKMIERAVEKLRESTYVDVREEMLDALAALPAQR
jgi:peptidyl-prolyl cis-trans isomerase SurA